jgi:hypothetical protein
LPSFPLPFSPLRGGGPNGRRCRFTFSELEFRGKLTGLEFGRQSASHRIACGTMTAAFDF